MADATGTEQASGKRALSVAVTAICKRAFDIVAAVFLLIATLPLTVTAAILVKLTSPGRLIYSQTRIGLNLRKKHTNDRRTASQRT